MVKKFLDENNIYRCIVIFLLIIPFLHISVRSLPYVYNDEFGYWVSAAHMVGMDWSEVFSIIPYYSYGYGFILALITSPAFLMMYSAYKLNKQGDNIQP